MSALIALRTFCDTVVGSVAEGQAFDCYDDKRAAELVNAKLAKRADVEPAPNVEPAPEA